MNNIKIGLAVALVLIFITLFVVDILNPTY